MKKADAKIRDKKYWKKDDDYLMTKKKGKAIDVKAKKLDKKADKAGDIYNYPNYD